MLNTTFKVDNIYKADLAAEAQAFLMEDAGLTADEVAALKTKLTLTLQDVYDSGKSLSSLLGDHENVYVQAVINGNVIREEYLDKQYSYSFYDAEYMNIGFDYASFTTNHSQYYCTDGTYAYLVMVTPNGMVDLAEQFAASGSESFISPMMLNDPTTMIEKDGLIIVSCTADVNDLLTMGEDIISCVETYTLDAKTHEMISIKTVYTYKDGSIEEGVVTITRDVEKPEGIKPFIAYDQETSNLRTITIVSNPGAENEKTEAIQSPKGLIVSFSPDWDVEKTATAYSDAACTHPFPEVPDTNVDVTVYLKWE